LLDSVFVSVEVIDRSDLCICTPVEKVCVEGDLWTSATHHFAESKLDCHFWWQVHVMCSSFSRTGRWDWMLVRSYCGQNLTFPLDFKRWRRYNEYGSSMEFHMIYDGSSSNS
jgi:hypothetical protein